MLSVSKRGALLRFRARVRSSIQKLGRQNHAALTEEREPKTCAAELPQQAFCIENQSVPIILLVGVQQQAPASPRFRLTSRSTTDRLHRRSHDLRGQGPHGAPRRIRAEGMRHRHPDVSPPKLSAARSGVCRDGPTRRQRRRS